MATHDLETLLAHRPIRAKVNRLRELLSVATNQQTRRTLAHEISRLESRDFSQSRSSDGSSRVDRWNGVPIKGGTADQRLAVFRALDHAACGIKSELTGNPLTAVNIVPRDAALISEYSADSISISLNEKIFGSAFQRTYEANKMSRWCAKSESDAVTYAVTHEFGHYLDARLSYRARHAVRQDLSEIFGGDIASLNADVTATIGDRVGIFASMQSEELIAEMWVSRQDGLAGRAETKVLTKYFGGGNDN